MDVPFCLTARDLSFYRGGAWVRAAAATAHFGASSADLRASLRLPPDAGQPGEMAGDAGQPGELAGDAGQPGEMAGDAGQLGEMAGDAGQPGEMAGAGVGAGVKVAAVVAA